MNNFIWFGRKLDYFCSYARTKLSCFLRISQSSLCTFFRVLVFHVNPFWIHLAYFIIISFIGYLSLKVSKPRTASSTPKDFDVFFTSVSATTVSSMSTLEMEVFSDTQLIILTIVMLVGGEVFTSLLGLQLARSKFSQSPSRAKNRSVISDETKPNSSLNSGNSIDQIELGLAPFPHIEKKKSNTGQGSGDANSLGEESLKNNSIKCLGYVILGYLALVHVVGYSLVSIYVNLVPSASKVLKTKGIGIQTFSIFTTVSSIANCGFVPTNENMIVFKKNSGLLLLIIPQILLGNTLYPSSLRFVIWVLGKITKRVELNYILKNYREMGYAHLLSGSHSCCLAMTVVGFIVVQLIVFCCLEWNSVALGGLSSFQKLVGSVFEVVNARHAGESVLDLSIISPAVLVAFMVMMYLPPCTSFLPMKGPETADSRNKKESRKGRSSGNSLEYHMALSQLSYLAIFVVLICITEREKLREDPLNFNVLSITLEVISAYGNVGFSMGYSCGRRLKHDSSCKDTWAGFSGRWSARGKSLLILVMFFGRLKKFSKKGGKAWKLS